MKRRIVTLLFVTALALSTITGCGSSEDANAELQEQLEELQEELEALQKEAEEKAAEVEEAAEVSVEEGEEEVEESTEEATEEVAEEVEESAEEAEDASEVSEAQNSDAEVSADWTNYAFSVNGTTLTLPCSYQELAEATGFAMKSSDAKSYIEAGYYTNVNLYTPDESLALYIDILNDTDDDLIYTECKVVSISQTEYQAVEQGASMITFAGGVQPGQEMTTADVEAVFGAPQDTYEYISEDSDYESYTWTYSEDPDYTYYNAYEITIVNGVVDQISLDHLYYE